MKSKNLTIGIVVSTLISFIIVIIFMIFFDSLIIPLIWIGVLYIIFTILILFERRCES